MHKIEVRFNQANFAPLPLGKNSKDGKRYALIEYMGGTQIVSNDALLPKHDDVTVVCGAGMMRGQISPSEVIDILKDGKSVMKTVNLKTA